MSKKIIKSSSQRVNAEIEPINTTIIGEYSGECADASITNANGMDITAEVFEKLFNSEEYKQAIKLGWYIGYLGHPEDPNCMDFKDSCIVMTEGHIDSDGKVYGKFNLIDTPVGRVVAALQDAGVTFGISIRGAGDLIGNSVDPDTFVFRGFDLVTFPAYPEAIPEFTKIAASTDLETQKKYKKVCKTLKDNLSSITSCEAIDVLKSQFAPQSDEYKNLEDREDELNDSKNSVKEIDEGDLEAITAEKLKAVTEMYIKKCNEVSKLKSQISGYRAELRNTKIKNASYITKLRSILGNQFNDVNKEIIKCKSEVSNLKKKVNATKQSNLIYKQKIEAQKHEISEKQSIISRLNAEKIETVNASKKLNSRTSDLDAQNKQLLSEKKALESVLASYQDDFASLYSSVTGVKLNDSVRVTANTSVEDLKSMINRCSTPKPTEVIDTIELSDVPEIEDDFTSDDQLICI